MSPFLVTLNEIVLYSRTSLYHCFQAIYSIIELTLNKSPFLPHITILCITFTFALHLIQTESSTLPQQIFFGTLLLSTILIITTTFTILRILEGIWYIKAKVSISKQPKARVLLDFEPFDWAHFNPVIPPPPQGAEPPQDNWDNWD